MNATTLLVYAALNGLFFLLMLQLQSGLGYSALQAGSSLLPINALVLVISPQSGKIGHRFGPRLPMVVAATGMLLFARVRPGAEYMTSVFPAAVMFGIGLGLFVAPLTTVALASLGETSAGLASGVNNAVARVAGLFATALIPIAAGLGGVQSLMGAVLTHGFVRAMLISAALCVVGAGIAAITISSSTQPRGQDQEQAGGAGSGRIANRRA